MRHIIENRVEWLPRSRKTDWQMLISRGLQNRELIWERINKLFKIFFIIFSCPLWFPFIQSCLFRLCRLIWLISLPHHIAVLGLWTLMLVSCSVSGDCRGNCVKHLLSSFLSGGSVWLWGGLHWSDDVWRPAGPVYSHPGAGDPHCRWQQGRCEDHPSLQPHPAWSQHTRQGGTHLVPAALWPR